jgi:hypothetical protein
MVDDVQPAIIWVLQRDLRRLARVDTAAGAVSFVPLDPSLPAGVEISGFEVFNGNVYIEPVRPDQTMQLVLVDQATGAPVATTEIAGSVRELAGQLVAYIDDHRTQLIDPATLAVTEAATEDVFTSESEPGPLWTVNVTEDQGQLHVTQYDGTFQVVGIGGAETGFKPSDFVQTEWHGTDDDVLYILASRQDADMWLDNRSLTQLYRLVPAS